MALRWKGNEVAVMIVLESLSSGAGKNLARNPYLAIQLSNLSDPLQLLLSYSLSPLLRTGIEPVVEETCRSCHLASVCASSVNEVYMKLAVWPRERELPRGQTV